MFDFERLLNANRFITSEPCWAVKYKYCLECKKAYVKSRLEKNNCINCGEVCEVVNVRRIGLYYLGCGVLLLGAVVVFLLRDISTILTWLVFICFILLGGMIIIMAGNKMAKSAAEIAKAEKQKAYENSMEEKDSDGKEAP